MIYKNIFIFQFIVINNKNIEIVFKIFGNIKSQFYNTKQILTFHNIFRFLFHTLS